MGRRIKRVTFLEEAGEQEWKKRAVCAESPEKNKFFPHLLSTIKYKQNWYSQHVSSVTSTYCARCPVQKRCLSYGQQTKSEGIWGGQLLDPLGRIVLPPKEKGPNQWRRLPKDSSETASSTMPDFMSAGT